jgi:hypothetical protein
VLEQLPKEGIMVASEKGQNNLPFHIGPDFEGCPIRPPNIKIHKDNIKTLNDS